MNEAYFALFSMGAHVTGMTPDAFSMKYITLLLQNFIDSPLCHFIEYINYFVADAAGFDAGL